MSESAREKVKPIVLRNTETNDEYVLEFNKDSVRFAEDRGFRLVDLDNFPATKIPEFFFYAFRMHHKNVQRNKTDKMLEEDLGGMSPKFLQRLVELYNETLNELVVEEGEVKNPKMEIEL